MRKIKNPKDVKVFRETIDDVKEEENLEQTAMSLARRRMAENKVIGMLLKEERLKTKFKAEEVARALGYTKSWLSRIEKGERGVSISDFFKLCKMYDIDLNEFLRKYSSRKVDRKVVNKDL